MHKYTWVKRVRGEIVESALMDVKVREVVKVERDRFGNKSSILEGKHIGAGSGVAGCQPSLGLSHTI